MLEWRNQDANREVSNNSHVITPEEHRAWWSRVAEDPTREVLVFEADGAACGVVSYFDVHPEATPGTASWGFYLDHDGLARSGTALVAWNRVMQEAIDHAFDVLGIDVLEAEVLAHNRAVRLTNRRFGFVEGEPFTRDVDGRTIEVVPVSLAKDNRRTRTKGK